MQQAIIAADTLQFTTSIADYPASDGWTLKFRLIPRTSGDAIEITAAAADDDPDAYEVSVSAATTAGWVPGDYSWAAWVEKDVEKFTVDGWVSHDQRYRGGASIAIKPDPRTVAAFDNRSHARKVLDAIEAVIENRATLDQEEYTINGRSLKRTPLDDLVGLRRRYQNEVATEDAAERVAQGLAPRRSTIQFVL